jgi:hypothetical protein
VDAVALQILHEGLKQDAAVIAAAAERARARLSGGHPGSVEAAGFELQRAYNVLEKALERVCESFENHFEKTGDYHEKLIERLSLALPEIRPAFLPQSARTVVRELKAFRQLFRHAYDLELRRDRVEPLVANAAEIAAEFPRWIETFVARVAADL